ncbi:MAG: hypothetical protein LAT78_05015 [Roseinatronobacter sp.]|nr:hypothetical protein [Roseinatronobacter sp.]
MNYRDMDSPKPKPGADHATARAAATDARAPRARTGAEAPATRFRDWALI